MRKDKVCFVSIDVEHDIGTDNDKKFYGVANVDLFLSILNRLNIPATLFVTGEVIVNYSKEVTEWSRKHEIACHSYSHRFFDTLSNAEISDDIEKFVGAYKSVLGGEPKGFRAPSHVINTNVAKIIEEKGFIYDSSVVPHYPPFKKYEGYKGAAPRAPYNPSELNFRKKGNMRIFEIPTSGQVFGIPLAGAWLKKLPPGVYKNLFKIHNPNFITFSVHSWDGMGYPDLYEKIEDILEVIKGRNYIFKTGEQIINEYFS